MMDMIRVRLSGEEWRLLSGQLETEGWLVDSYDPRNGKRCLCPTRFGEAHYVRACKILGVNKIFKGKKYTELTAVDNFSDIFINEKYFYKLGLFTEVFNDVYHSKITVKLTRQGYEWFHAYTKLRFKKRKHYGNSAVRRWIGALASIIFACFYILALRLSGAGRDE